MPCKDGHPSPETRAKLSAARRKRPPCSIETRAKISAASKLHAQMGLMKPCWEGASRYRKGRKMSDETKKKLSLALTGKKRYMTPEAAKRRREAISRAKTGKHPTEEQRERWREKRLREKETALNTSETEIRDLYLNKQLNIRQVAKLKNTTENIISHLLTQYGIPHRNPTPKFDMSKEELIDLYCNHNLIISEIAKLKHKNFTTILGLLDSYNIQRRNHAETMQIRPDLREKWYASTSKAAKITLKALHQDEAYVDKLIRGNHYSPNKAETALEQMLLSIDLPYKYVGDGSFRIKWYCPDYVNINGKKNLIEFNGCYFHGCPICGLEKSLQAERAIKRDRRKQQVYKNFGWNCLIIWEHELKNPQALLEKVKEFENAH